jgi:hypothetical protein
MLLLFMRFPYNLRFDRSAGLRILLCASLAWRGIGCSTPLQESGKGGAKKWMHAARSLSFNTELSAPFSQKVLASSTASSTVERSTVERSEKGGASIPFPRRSSSAPMAYRRSGGEGHRVVTVTVSKNKVLSCFSSPRRHAAPVPLTHGGGIQWRRLLYRSFGATVCQA